jgi:hypothetical protein
MLLWATLTLGFQSTSRDLEKTSFASGLLARRASAKPIFYPEIAFMFLFLPSSARSVVESLPLSSTFRIFRPRRTGHGQQ